MKTPSKGATCYFETKLSAHKMLILRLQADTKVRTDVLPNT